MKRRRLSEIVGIHLMPYVAGSALVVCLMATLAGAGLLPTLLIGATLLVSGYLIHRAVTTVVFKSVADLYRGIMRLRGGRLDHRLSRPAVAEFAAMADAVNAMAGELQSRIATVVNQSSLVETIFASMAEGILAIDADSRIIDLNDAAAEQLSLNRKTALGREISEVIRNREILEFIRRAHTTQTPLEDTLVLYGDQEQYLQTRGNLLKDSTGEVIGALVVFHDMTQMRRLENLRRDFAANVSHELKTPITSIKGFVETLQDGALADQESARRFLSIIGREADRLTAIVEDLMSLARIEQQEERGGIDLSSRRIKDALNDAVQTCKGQADDRNIEVRLVCPNDLRALINPQLLEQAVINLVDNAVKYSDEGGSVVVRGMERDGKVAVAVQDWGCGIAEEHLSRLFERFYRVDKARSRSQGGTGLGLAIVKHIVLAMGGTVTVESRIGRGSTFTIELSQVENRVDIR